MKTVSGRKVSVLCTDRKGFAGKFPVLALVQADNGDEIAIPYRNDLILTDSQWFPNENLSLVAETSEDREIFREVMEV